MKELLITAIAFGILAIALIVSGERWNCVIRRTR